MPLGEHEQQVVDTVRCAVITVSDSRTIETDRAGELISRRLTEAGHVIVVREIVADDGERIASLVRGICEDGECDAILSSGGTGICRRDRTYEAIAGLLDVRMDGFGELFRMLSYEQIGAAAMLSRAVAGLCSRTVVFSMPGSPAAVELAMDRLILPELAHVVFMARS